MTRMLVSVATVDEARLAVAGGADLIDCKDPTRGALAALPTDQIVRIRQTIGTGVESSATTGDDHASLPAMCNAVQAVAATGVSYVKVALQSEFHAQAVTEALVPLTGAGHRIILVAFADDSSVRERLQSLIALVADAGLCGIMLDTANKTAGGLRTHIDDTGLMQFVTDAKARGLMTGLAGSLGLDDVPPLVAMTPDYLGFRGALCANAVRSDSFDESRMAEVRAALLATQPELIETRRLAGDADRVQAG